MSYTRHYWGEGGGRNTLYRSDNRYNNNNIYIRIKHEKNTRVQVQQLYKYLYIIWTHKRLQYHTYNNIYIYVLYNNVWLYEASLRYIQSVFPRYKTFLMQFQCKIVTYSWNTMYAKMYLVSGGWIWIVKSFRYTL